MPTVNVLGTPRFSCLGCGACCHGVKVEMVDAQERERILGFAQEWGAGDPFDGDFLQQESGRCVFQDADGLCGIHKRHGIDAKPEVCKQFPFVLISTETGELRAGVDPGSFNILATWDTAEPLPPPARVVPRPAPRSPEQTRAETTLLSVLNTPGVTIGGFARVLAGQAPTSERVLPDGFASRLVTVLQRSSLPLVLQARDAGPAQVAALQPLLDVMDTLDPQAPPPWPVLAPSEEAFALEMLRRMLYLRLATTIPIVQGVALITMVGIVGNAWACPDPERYGPAMASWTRLLRAGPFWQSITPRPRDMQWLATGRV